MTAHRFRQWRAGRCLYGRERLADLAVADIKSDLVAGNNVIAIAPYNVSGAGGFIAALQMDFTRGRGRYGESDPYPDRG